MASADTKHLYPIAVLIDELKSEDQKKRWVIWYSLLIGLTQWRTCRRLRWHWELNAQGTNYFHTYWVSKIPWKTLPFCIDLMDDEEEVLLALAEVLGPQFMDFVGGPAHALSIIRILEKLCQLDESTVRDKVFYFSIWFVLHRLLRASRKYSLAWDLKTSRARLWRPWRDLWTGKTISRSSPRRSWSLRSSLIFPPRASRNYSPCTYRCRRMRFLRWGKSLPSSSTTWSSWCPRCLNRSSSRFSLPSSRMSKTQSRCRGSIRVSYSVNIYPLL